jgi:hypothetical protein
MEWLPLSFGALFSLLSGSLLFLLKRRYIHEDRVEAARNLKIEAIREGLEAHKHRSGLQTNNIQYRMGIMAAQIQRVIPEVDIPDWPSGG